jgi:hypothetical protein
MEKKTRKEELKKIEAKITVLKVIARVLREE